MDVHFFGTAVLISLLICAPLIVASVIALILGKRPLSWVLYGIGAGVSAVLLIGGNIYKDVFAKSDTWKPVLQSIGSFTSLKGLAEDPGFQAVLQQNPAAGTPIRLYYYTNWSMTIALVFFLVFALTFLLLLIVYLNKKRENYVRGELTAQYQSISFK